eukprot:COSAG01_NODE_23281_length_821_cov_0.839335_1_plen_21_part_10
MFMGVYMSRAIYEYLEEIGLR